MVSTQLKNFRQIGSSPQVGVKIKHIWNHHLEWHWMVTQSTKTSHTLPSLQQGLQRLCVVQLAWPYNAENQIWLFKKKLPSREESHIPYLLSHLSRWYSLLLRGDILVSRKLLPEFVKWRLVDDSRLILRRLCVNLGQFRQYTLPSIIMGKWVYLEY